MAKSLNLEYIRHSLAHLLAAAVLKKWPDTKLGIGPVIENGFYYDFLFIDKHGSGEASINTDSLKEIELEMRAMIKAKLAFSGREVSVAEAKKLFANQPFKVELAEEFARNATSLTVYTTGDSPAGGFTDLCRGGHVENTSEIDPDAFKLTKLAGAYWRGDEKNAQLTRIYGVAFATKTELDAYLKMVEEAEKRDHKKLGPELDLFVFSPLVGSGLPLWTPKGTLLRDLLDNFVWELRKKYGYERVDIPHLAKKDLYETSGHWEKFKDDLFRITTREGHLFALKPMNCPHHTQIYNRKQWSYRELPQRYTSTTKVYRDEQSGELAGLARVRAITQDDAHVFCRMEQIKEEALKIWDIIHEFYGVFGIPLRVRLSLRDPRQPEKYLGDNTNWEKAEGILREVVSDKKIEYIDGVGEAAFYGPKLDFMGRDALGREHQVATIQLDMNMPERFDLTCVNEKGASERIVMIHAAIMGALERFIALLIEHTAGHFPLWLAPVQARVIAVSEKYQKYAEEVADQLRSADLPTGQAGIRAELADSSETLGKRIRAAQMEKIPYALVVGEEEKKNGTVAVRHAMKGDLGKLPLQKFIEQLQNKITSRAAR